MSQTNDPRPLVERLDAHRAALQSYMGSDCLHRPTTSDVRTMALLDEAAIALAAEPAPVTREPDAWRWRMRHSATEPWDDWRYAPMRPLITPDAYAQVEPLFASPSAGGVTGAEASFRVEIDYRDGVRARVNGVDLPSFREGMTRHEIGFAIEEIVRTAWSLAPPQGETHNEEGV